MQMVRPQNYDVFNRPRRQDFEGLLMENGAVYCTNKDAFLKSNNRVSGNIGLIEMPEETLMEIDSVSDWEIVENILITRQKKMKTNQRIQYLVLDVDGVFYRWKYLIIMKRVSLPKDLICVMAWAWKY